MHSSGFKGAKGGSPGEVKYLLLPGPHVDKISPFNDNKDPVMHPNMAFWRPFHYTLAPPPPPFLKTWICHC